MRFILFNAVVAGALIYLFSGADQPGADARRSVDDAMARLAALSEEAVARVESLQQSESGPAAPDAPTPAPPDTDAAGPVPDVTPRPVPSQPVPSQPVPASPATVTKSAPVPTDAPAPEPDATPAPLPVREVAAVPTHRVPRPGDSGPVAAPPATASIDIAEPMMSSKDRRKELFSLAQEMELLYATRVNR